MIQNELDGTKETTENERNLPIFRNHILRPAHSTRRLPKLSKVPFAIEVSTSVSISV